MLQYEVEMELSEVKSQLNELLAALKQWELWRELGPGAADQPDEIDCRALIAKCEPKT